MVTEEPRGPAEWALLTYKIPSQPTRLRLQIWRRLQRMGALFVNNAVWILPARPELVENMNYIASEVEEMGGACHVFVAAAHLPGSADQIAEEFRAMADSRLQDVLERLDGLCAALESAASPSSLERIEDELKRERIAYLRARRLAYFGCGLESAVDDRLEGLRCALDSLYRSAK